MHRVKIDIRFYERRPSKNILTWDRARDRRNVICLYIYEFWRQISVCKDDQNKFSRLRTSSRLS